MNRVNHSESALYAADKAIESLHIEQGDITQYSCDILVCPDNQKLSGTSSVAKALHFVAGPEMEKATKLLEGCSIGDVKVIPGFQSKAKKILFTASPKWNAGIDYEEMYLAKCYDSIMSYAIENGCQTLVIPSIGTGFHHFPKTLAAEIAVDTIVHHLKRDASIDVTIVCSSNETFEIYKKAFKIKIVQEFLSFYNPTAYVCNQLSFKNMAPYYNWMTKLRDLESVPHNYLDYMAKLNADAEALHQNDFEKSFYLLSKQSQGWDYRTCLAYIIFLQRKSHWDEGYTHPHDEQCRLGGVRNALLRMKELLEQKETHASV